MKNWNSMHERVKDYLTTRRRLGYQLKIEGYELYRFAQFADKNGKNEIISINLVIDWANTSKKDSQLYRARRVEIVRGLAKYCALFEIDTQIPPARLFGPAHRRVAPYIYTVEELSGLMQATRMLSVIGQS